MKFLNKKISMMKYLLLLGGVSLLVGCTNDKDSSGLNAKNDSESRETIGSSDVQVDSKNLNDIFEFYEIDYSIPKSISEISGFYKGEAESILYISDKGEYIYMDKTNIGVKNYFDKNQTLKNYDGIFSKYAPGKFGKIFEVGNDYMTATTGDRLYPFVDEKGDSSLIALVNSSNFKDLKNEKLFLDNFEKFTPEKELEQLFAQHVRLIDSNDKELPILSYDKIVQTIIPIKNLNDLYMNLINFRAHYGDVDVSGDTSYKIEGISGMSQEELNVVTFSNGKKEQLTDGLSIKYGYDRSEESIGSVYYFTNGTYIYATNVLKEKNSEGIIINTDTNYAGTAIEADPEIKNKALNRLEEAYEYSTYENSTNYGKYFYGEDNALYTLIAISSYKFDLLTDSFQLEKNKSGEFYNFEIDFGYKKETSGHINGEYDFINNKFHIEKIDFTETGIKKYEELSENYISEQRKQETKAKHEQELENNK